MNSANPAALVQAGFEAQNQGDLARAEAAYRRALALQPEHPAALQLLGSLLRRQGDMAQAEALLRRSLAAQNKQPHVWNNLGNLLHAVGRSQDALPCFDNALAQAAPATFAEAHYNRARVLHSLSRLAEAAVSLNQALTLTPQPTAAMLQLQAQMQGDSGLVETALATLDKALRLAPDKASLLHNRAVMLQRAHRHAESLATHERAAALGLDSADSHYNHGNTLQSLGRHDEAQAAYRRALAHAPAHALTLFDLARLRWRLGQADFDSELHQAIALDPGSAVLPGLHAHLLWRAERYADAAAAYRLALQNAPQAASLLDGLGRCLVRLGDTAGGLQAHHQAVAAAPQDVEIRTNLVSSLLVAGLPQNALAEAEVACTLAPAHQHAQALRALALRLLGRTIEADALCDAKRFVGVFDLPPPPGFADMGSFNAALAQELQALHGDRQAPIDQTLRGGTQTLGQIFEQGHPLVNALKARIVEAVNTFVVSLPQDGAHPFLGRRAGSWRFTDSWSSRLSAQGFHTDHVHPHGWVSSAYYVAVPDGVAEHPQHEGWLQFGRPDLPLPGLDRDSLVQRRVSPRPGRLVLFPSMLWHGTVPFCAAAERLTLAFDIVPA